jgi:hypothetical protein
VLAAIPQMAPAITKVNQMAAPAIYRTDKKIDCERGSCDNNDYFFVEIGVQ